MSLQDELKAKALALVSQQMASWVVEIQRHIAEHQGNIVRQLDELQEVVARYDERMDEAAIGSSIAEVVAAHPAPAPPPVAQGPGIDALKASLVQIDKGASLSEVLTFLVDEVQQYVERAAMFIVKGPTAIGWYARGVPPDVIKQVQVPLSGDTVFRIVQNGRSPLRGHASHSPGTIQALAKLGGSPQGILAVPLILRDKLAAILYCDTSADEVAGAHADLIEILVQSAAKTIDILSLAPKPAAAAARSTVPPSRPAAPPPPPPPAAAPAPAPAAGAGDASTMMFRPGALPGTAAPPRPAPPAAAPPSPDEQKAHDEAKRFARLVVSEIKLYNESKVAEGRRHRDLYERLKDDIERGRQMYDERVPAHVRDATNYFFDELVRILAGGDAGALGPM